MKVGVITIAIVSLALSAARGNQILDFVELGEGHFAVQLNHHPWPHAHIDIGTGGGGELYTITLDEGYSFEDGAFPLEIDEPGSPHPPGDPSSIFTNFISFSETEEGLAQMVWQSEGVTSAAPSHNNPFTVTGGVMGPGGVKFDVRLSDVPEPSSTLSLLGIGLAGLAWLGMVRRRRAT